MTYVTLQSPSVGVEEFPVKETSMHTHIPSPVGHVWMHYIITQMLIHEVAWGFHQVQNG